ncbi:MAG: hypothetical protein HN916_14375 [Anaerolineae bacterium]|jgi:hypothetical protein|nr:hypothetical protein [Anaerolineae bacterium]MBT7992220.1 hypothetical protein [Anaerolineae bacterium]
MKKNISADSRVDAFARELAIALRRISGRQTENKPANLPTPKQEKIGHKTKKDDEAD